MCEAPRRCVVEANHVGHLRKPELDRVRIHMRITLHVEVLLPVRPPQNVALADAHAAGGEDDKRTPASARRAPQRVR